MTHRTTRQTAAVVTLTAGSIALAGCISLGPKIIDNAPAGVPHPTSTKSAGTPSEDDLIVRTAGTELRLGSLPDEAGGEGMPDDTPALTGDDLYVFVRQDGWMLFAEQRGGDVAGCGLDQREPAISSLGDGWWKVSNRSYADTYALWLYAGSGPGLPIGGTVGSSQAYVKWTIETTFDAPAISALDVTTYGDAKGLSLTLSLFDVEAPLAGATATVTLLGPDGGLDTELTVPDWACDQPGDLTLAARATEDQLATLGDPDEFDYTVELRMGGVTYTASGPVTTSASAEPVWTPALP